VPNAALTLLNVDNQYQVYNSLGTVNVLVDVVGVFEPGMTASMASVKAGKPAFHFSEPRKEPLSGTPVAPLFERG
jgi:hypothetical protein